MADLPETRVSNTSPLFRAQIMITHGTGRFAKWLALQAHSYGEIARANSPGLALKLAALNLFRVRRVLHVRIFDFEVTLRSGTPDLSVAVESLGHELDPVTRDLTTGNRGLIIDGGGYIGTAAIKLARHYPDCPVVCVEPSSANLEILRANIAPYPNITVLHSALAAAETDVVLRDPGRLNWGFTIIAEPDQHDRVLETVRATTIEQILADRGADHVFILKLDIEGAEVEVLRHSAGWMPRTDVIIIELHEWIIAGCEAVFTAATAGRKNKVLPGEKVLSLR